MKNVKKIESLVAKSLIVDNILLDKVMVAPSMAAELLSCLPPVVEFGDDGFQQRELKRKKIAEFVRELKGGFWKFNGDSIVTDTNGHLIDGQNRLAAIVESGVSVPMIIVRGVEHDSIDTIDRGSVRTRSDILAMSGLTVRTSKMAAVVASLENEYSRFGTLMTKNRNHTISASETVAFVKARPNLIAACNWANDHCKVGCLFTKSHIAFLLYRFEIARPEFDNKEFLLGLVSGAEMASDDPRIWIRNRRVREMTSVAKSSAKTKLAWICKAWNRRVIGRKLTNESNFFTMNIDNELSKLG